MPFLRARLFQTEFFRLTAIYAGLFLGSTAILLALIYFIVNHAFEASLLRASSDDLAAIRRAYVGGAPRHKALHEAKEMVDDRLLAGDPADYFLLQQDGRMVAGNMAAMIPRLGVQVMPSQQTPRGDILGQGEFLAPGLFAFAGRDRNVIAAAERQVMDTFMIVFCISLVMAMVGGLLLSRSFIQRLDAMTATCRSIMAGRLQDRIPERDSRNELDQLANSINAMLDRIGVLMESLKQVSNDIAHDLRTPLAHLRYRLESVRAEAQNMTDYSTAVDAAIGHCDQLLGMFAAMLRIAQIEAGARQAGMQDVSLNDVLHKVAAFYEPMMEEAGHPFEARIGQPASLRGDPQLLFQMFANLLDNAIRHTPRGSCIRLTSACVASRAQVVIADEGPGIPAEDRGKVFRRFFRLDQSRATTGSGLGLSLVAAIADLHNAQVELLDNTPGLRAVVGFPTQGAFALIT